MRRTTVRGSGSWGIVAAVIVVMVLAGALYAGWRYWKGAAEVPTSQPAGLVSEDRILFGGMPRSTRAGSGFTVLKNMAYIVGYSEARKDPLWSAYRVKHMERPFHLERPKGEFITDTRTRAQVAHHDFTGSGYDRGHMTPNSAIAHCYGAEAQLETFRLSNICPQAPALNQKVWERLEKDELEYADKYGEVWVVDGPVFGDFHGGFTRLLRSGIAVPEGFYKILLENEGGKVRVFAVIMPQTVKGTEMPSQFVTSVGEIEKETGLEFFPELQGAAREGLESRVFPQW